MQKKVYEDYEPISGGSVCFAVATTLMVSFFVQSLSSESKKESVDNTLAPQKITTQILPVKQKNYWVMHKDR